MVEAGEEATFYYAFFPNEGFAGRPFGLTVNVNYKDSVRFTQAMQLRVSQATFQWIMAIVLLKPQVNVFFQADNFFQDAVFNETVTIIESDEGMDGET